jgi:hypothetical protein
MHCYALHVLHIVYQEADSPDEGLQILSVWVSDTGCIEVAHMMRKHQFSTTGQSAFQQFGTLAA